MAVAEDAAGAAAGEAAALRPAGAALRLAAWLSGRCFALKRQRSVRSTGAHATALAVCDPTAIDACPASLVIGSKLDADVHTDKCRLAFFGRMVRAALAPVAPQPHALCAVQMQPLDPSPAVLRQLKVYKWKEREGQVDRCGALAAALLAECIQDSSSPG